MSTELNAESKLKLKLYLLRTQASELYTVEACRDVIVQLLDTLLEHAQQEGKQ